MHKKKEMYNIDRKFKYVNLPEEELIKIVSNNRLDIIHIKDLSEHVCMAAIEQNIESFHHIT